MFCMWLAHETSHSTYEWSEEAFHNRRMKVEDEEFTLRASTPEKSCAPQTVASN